MTLLGGCAGVTHGFDEESETIMFYDPNAGE